MIGHLRQLQLLDSHIRSGSFSHAYLFSGPRHVGKTTFAKKIAAALLCEEKESGTEMVFSCGACQACKLAKAGTHPDLVVVDAEKTGETSLRLEDMQEIRERAALSAYGGTRIFIIRDVSKITREAANAFLKVLEEPRGQVVFLLIADVADDVLATIRSRVWHVRFWPVSEELLTVGLQKKHHSSLEEATHRARLAGGLPGIAIRLATSPDEQNLLENEHKQVRTLFGASLAERMKYAEKLRENPEGMQTWFTKSIAVLANMVHTSLQKRNPKAADIADQCKILMQHEEQFSKPYGIKRIIFEDALITLP